MSKSKSQTAISVHLKKHMAPDPNTSYYGSQLTAIQRNHLESEWEKHKMPIFEYLMRGTGNYHDASDLLSETWIKLQANFHQFRGGRANTKAWIFRISVNLVNDYYRKKRHETSLDSPDAPELRAYRQQQPDVAFQLKQLSQIIRQALALLPEEQRNILLLRYDNNISSAQVAAILEIPVGTVYSRCSNSKVELLNILRELGYEGALNHEM